MEKKPDMVNHPAHYTYGKFECADVIEDWGLSWQLGNALKYICRCGHKSDDVEDLKKAVWYINREIERRTGGAQEKDVKHKYTFDEYGIEAARTMNPYLMPQEQEQHALFEIASETGEVLGLYQKVFQGHKLDDVHLMKEIGDVLWGLNELCVARKRFSLSDCAELNIAKLKERYPDGFDAEHSLHRKEGDV